MNKTLLNTKRYPFFVALKNSLFQRSFFSTSNRLFSLTGMFSLFILVACATGGRMVTSDSFHEVPMGVSGSEVVATIGKPYSIKDKKDGTVEYEYIERIKIGNRNMDTRRYVIILKDDRVIEKHVKDTLPIPYYLNNPDSYDMQTTQNDHSS